MRARPDQSPVMEADGDVLCNISSDTGRMRLPVEPPSAHSHGLAHREAEHCLFMDMWGGTHTCTHTCTHTPTSPVILQHGAQHPRPSPATPPPPPQLCVRAELRHQPASYFGVLLVVVLLRADPAAHQVVPHRVSQGEVVVPLGGHIPVLHQREVEVSVEIRLEVRDVLHAGQSPHGDLLPLVLVRQRLRHGVALPCSLGVCFR